MWSEHRSWNVCALIDSSSTQTSAKPCLFPFGRNRVKWNWVQWVNCVGALRFWICLFHVSDFQAWSEKSKRGADKRLIYAVASRNPVETPDLLHVVVVRYLWTRMIVFQTFQEWQDWLPVGRESRAMRWISVTVRYIRIRFCSIQLMYASDGQCSERTLNSLNRVLAPKSWMVLFKKQPSTVKTTFWKQVNISGQPGAESTVTDTNLLTNLISKRRSRF